MAIEMTRPNSLNMRPTTPPMNSTGMNTATSDSVIDTMVKPTSLEPLKAASIGFSPASMWRTMFSSMTIASSTTKPTASVSASSEMLSIEWPQHVHAGEGADHRDRQRDRRDQRGAEAAQEEVDRDDDQHAGQAAA